MTPINYTTENNIARFQYETEAYNKWIKQGEDTGDVGFLLMGIDYNTKFYLYEGFGTIENPITSLHKVDMQHDNMYDGELSTVESIMNPPEYKPSLNATFSYAILNFGE